MLLLLQQDEQQQQQQLQMKNAVDDVAWVMIHRLNCFCSRVQSHPHAGAADAAVDDLVEVDDDVMNGYQVLCLLRLVAAVALHDDDADDDVMKVWVVMEVS